MPTKEEIELAARAIHNHWMLTARAVKNGELSPLEWSEIAEGPAKEHFRTLAKAALEMKPR
jgi:hypothetical protein